MITLYALVLITLTSVVSVDCGNRKSDEPDKFDMTAGLDELNKYLESNVNTDSVQDNVDAANKLINNFLDSNDQTTCFFGLCKSRAKEEPLEVMAAKRFVHLLSVGDTTTSVGCTQMTFNYLQDLENAHWLPYLKAMKDSRHHLDRFGRVDRLLDEILETLIIKCSLFVDRMYELRVSQLPAFVRRDIFNLTDEDVLSIDKYDYNPGLVKLFRKFDPVGYEASLKEATERKFSGPLINHYKQVNQKIFKISCDLFTAQFKDVLDRFNTITAHAQRYNIKLEHSQPAAAALNRTHLCYMNNGLRWEAWIHDKAKEIYAKHRLGSL